MNYQAIHQEAVEAANKAEQEYFEKYGEPMYCGFAWVSVRVTRTNSKEAIGLKSIGFKNSWMPKRVELWNVTSNGTQSMDIKEQGARAYAEVLRKHGIEAYAASRAD